MLYVDSSAFAKRYLKNEVGHEACLRIMAGDPEWVTSRLTIVESHRTLSLSMHSVDASIARNELNADLARAVLADIDRDTIAAAADISIQTGIRSLDAIHLATAARICSDLTILTFDKRQARTAQQLGLQVATV